MTDTARARKLADRVREVVAEALEKRIKDPRLGFITVTDTRVTGDLQHATVFYTVFGDDEERAATAAALESAKGVLRSEVGRRTGIRLTPSLEFIMDALPESAAQMADLLAVAQERDAAVAALANGAEYAGDPDPYRKPAAEADDELDDGDDFDDEDAVMQQPGSTSSNASTSASGNGEGPRPDLDALGGAPDPASHRPAR